MGAKHGKASSSIRRCKRKRGGDIEPRNTNMVNLTNSFFTNVSSQTGELVAKVGMEKDAKGQRHNLFKDLAFLPLSSADKILVSKKICANMNDVDIFCGLDDEQRAEMVAMVLTGSYYR